MHQSSCCALSEDVQQMLPTSHDLRALKAALSVGIRAVIAHLSRAEARVLSLRGCVGCLPCSAAPSGVWPLGMLAAASAPSDAQQRTERSVKARCRWSPDSCQVATVVGRDAARHTPCWTSLCASRQRGGGYCGVRVRNDRCMRDDRCMRERARSRAAWRAVGARGAVR